MKNKQLFLLVIFCLLELFLCTKKILMIEGDDLDYILKESYEKKHKLFLVFSLKKCPYCTKVLKTLKDNIATKFEEEDKITFGNVDLDNQKNVWQGFRFNIINTPYIILIENNRLYHFQNQFEEKIVLKFIKEEKNLEEGEQIPCPLTFWDKFQEAMRELTEKIQQLLENFGINIKWNMKFSYALLVLFLLFLLLIENEIINICRNLCQKKKNDTDDKNVGKEKNSEVKTVADLKTNKNNEKHKKE